MGLRVKPATQKTTVVSREGGAASKAASKAASTIPTRGAGGRMQSSKPKGYSREGGRVRTIGRIVKRMKDS